MHNIFNITYLLFTTKTTKSVYIHRLYFKIIQDLKKIDVHNKLQDARVFICIDNVGEILESGFEKPKALYR